METSRGAVDSWSCSDVLQWLAEWPALSKYGADLEGTTGKELLCLDNDLLVDAGITNGLHRMQLLNRRDELLLAEKQASGAGLIQAAGPVHRSPASSGTPSWGRQSSGLQVSGLTKTKSFTAHALTRTATMQADSQQLKAAAPSAPDLHLVTLGPAGLALEPTHSGSAEVKIMLAKMLNCYRNMERAFYGQANLRSLLGYAVQVQSEVLARQAASRLNGLLADFCRILAELEDFTSDTCTRGWFNRLKSNESSLTECQRIYGLLAELISDHGLSLELTPQEEFTDAAGSLRAQLNAGGSADPWLNTSVDAGLALRLAPLLDQEPSSQLNAAAASEIAFCAATECFGPHSIIRHAQLRVFWWQCFRMVEEVPWDTFWSSFPKALDPAQAAELGKIFVTKANRLSFQRLVSRRTQQALTSVELDFVFPPACSLQAQCDALLRPPSNMGRTPNMSWGRTGLARSPSSPIPTLDQQLASYASPGMGMAAAVGLEDAVDDLVDLLCNAEEPCQIVNIVGPAGYGKSTLANSVVSQMLTMGHWEFSQCVDLTACTSGAACIFAFLSACGVPTDTADDSALTAWLARNADMAFGLVVQCPKSLPVGVMVRLTFLLQRIYKIAGNAKILIVSEQKVLVPDPDGPEGSLLNDATYESQKMNDEASLKLLQRLAPEVNEAQATQLAHLCEGLPAALQLVAAGIATSLVTPDDLLDNPDLSDSGSETGESKLHRIIRQVVGELEEDMLHAFLLLSIFPASFSTLAAAEVLGLAGNLFHTRSILRSLVEVRLLTAMSEGRWTLAKAVRQSALGLTSELGLANDSAKASLVAYYATMLMRSAAIAISHAPMAAARLLDLSQASIFEVISWARTAPWSSVGAFADIVWDCMRMLAPRMELLDRLDFCWATHDLAVGAGDHTWRGRALYQCGMAYIDQGRWNDAEQRLTEALKILEDELGLDHLHLARVCSGLAVVKYKRGEWDAVQDMFARAYDIQSTQLGADDPELALTMTHSAGLLKAMNKHADAEIVYRTVLDMRERTLGPDHLEVAASLNNIAVLLSSKPMGRFDEAELLYKRSIAIKEKALGPAHFQVAMSLNNLASLLRKTGQLEEAEQLYRKALAICEDDLGPENPQVANSYTNLAGLLRGQNRMEEALAFSRQALAIRKRALAREHPDLAALHMSLAHLLRDLGQFEEAVHMCKEAVNGLLLSHGGEDNPHVATALCLQATLQTSLGNAAQAEAMCRRALDIRTRLYGSGHADTAAAMCALCDALHGLGRLSEAEHQGKRALELLKASPGAGSLPYADCLFCLAALYMSQQRWVTAATSSRKCLAIREEQVPLGSPQIAEAQVQLASILQHQEEHAQAEALLRSALTTREKVLGLQHPLTTATLASLRNICSSSSLRQPQVRQNGRLEAH